MLGKAATDFDVVDYEQIQLVDIDELSSYFVFVVEVVRIKERAA